MNTHEFMTQDEQTIDAIFKGLYAHLRQHHGINVSKRVYRGDRSPCTTDFAAWLLFNDNNVMAYVEYDEDNNMLTCRRINTLEIDYKIPEPKCEDLCSMMHIHADISGEKIKEFLDKGWCSLKEDIDKKQTETLKRLREQMNEYMPLPNPKDSSDALEELRELFKSFYESKSKPEPTLKSIINSSMDELMSEIASMKQKAQPTINKMERVYKAMMTELSKDD